MISYRWLVSVFFLLLIFSAISTLKAQATSDEPSRDEFIDVTEEPREIVELNKLLEYPEVAMRSGLEGKVRLEALIDTNGNVRRVEVLNSDYDIFRDEAVRAVKSARFTPAKMGDKKVMLWVTRTINFKLNDRFSLPNILGNDIEGVRSFFRPIGAPQEVNEKGDHYLRVVTFDTLSHGFLPAQAEARFEDGEAVEFMLLYRGLNEFNYSRLARADFTGAILHQNQRDFDYGNNAEGRIAADSVKHEVRVSIWKKR